jgi:glycosyltransferase involved in cell wall biosynthesis
LIFPSWYIESGNPVSGIFFREQAQALHQKGINVSVLVVQKAYRLRNIIQYIRDKNKVTFYNDNGIKTYIVKYICFTPKNQKCDLFIAAWHFKKYFKILQKNLTVHFDLVHIHSALDAGIIYCLSKCKTKFIITEHSSDYSSKNISPAKYKYLYNVFSSASAIVVVGNGLKKDISIYTKRQIYIIFNLISINSYFPKYDKNKTKFRFFSLGLEVYLKGMDVLISAFKNTSIYSLCDLYIAGLKEKEIVEMQNFVNKEGMSSNIKILGLLSREEVASYMYNCDCFVLPSRFETFGVVFAEAMYFGKPVIASATGGPDSYITPETGILVPVENIEATSKAMEAMFFNKDKYNSEYIKNFAINNFSSDVITTKIIDIYKKALERSADTSN